MMNTSAAMPMMIISGNASRKPTPRVAKPRIVRITKMIAIVMLKFSASLAWSFTNGMESFFTSQMISGPRNQPQPPIQPVTKAPSKADRCANMAHWRSSAVGGAPAGGGVPADAGGVTDSGGTLIANLPQSSDGTGRDKTLVACTPRVKHRAARGRSRCRAFGRDQMFHGLCAGAAGEHTRFQKRFRNTQMRRQNALEYRAEIGGRVHVAVLVKLARPDTRPIAGHSSTAQRAAREEHRTAGTVIGAAGTVDVRGAAELGGDDHECAIPRLSH